MCKGIIKFLSVLFFCMFFFGLLEAQEKTFHVGFSGLLSSNWIINQNNFGTLDGFNNSSVKRSELDYALTFGGGGGVDIGYNFSNRHGFQSGLYFVKQGQKYSDDMAQENYNTTPTSIDYVEVNRNIKLNYIKLPLLYKFESLSKRGVIRKKVAYYASLGPVVSYLVALDETVDIADLSIENNVNNVSEADKFKKIDIGIAINNGVNFRFNERMYLNTGLHIYVGLIDLNGKTIKDLEYFSKNDVEYKPSHNFNASLNVGLHFLLSNKKYY